MPREVAAAVLTRVWEEGAYSHIALSAELEKRGLDARDRGLATELVYGTLTWAPALDTLLEREVKGGLRKVEDPVRVLLRLGAYQLMFLDRVPEHAVLHEMVQMAKGSRETRRAQGLVNAVLRAVATRVKGDAAGPRWWAPEDRERKPVRYLSQRWVLPPWMANRLIQLLGLDEAETAAQAFCARAPLWLRVHGAHAIEGLLHSSWLPGAAIAPGWSAELHRALEAGQVAIQDLGSQAIGWMTGARPGAHVLDLCAGLGGKSLHLAHLGAQVTSVEPLPQKLELLKAAARTQGVDVKCFQGTVQQYAQSAGAGDFDAVLVDAPCSGFGVIRRHPETRWTKTEAVIGQMVPVQRDILAHAKGLVKPGGALVYSVCTFMVEEGKKQVQRFLEENPGILPTAAHSA